MSAKPPKPEPGRPAQTPAASPLDRAALEAMYRERSPYVAFTLRRLGVPERYLNDSLHDVFVVVLRRLPEYEDRGHLLAWLSSIATNVARRYRDRERQEPLAEPDTGEPPPTPSAQPALEALNRARVLLASIEDPKRRAILVRHEIEGDPIPEIARDLGMQDGTAYNHLRLGREEIKAADQRLHGRDGRGEGAMIFPLLGAVDAEHGIPPLPQEVMDEVWARLQQSPEYQHLYGSGDGGGSGPCAPGRAARRRKEAAALVRKGGPTVAALAVGVLIGALWDPLHRSAPAVEARPESISIAAPTPPAPNAGPSHASPVPSADPTPPRPSAAWSPSGADGEEQRSLIRHADRGLDEGDTARAQAALREHAEVYGDAQLGEERDAALISVLLRAGKTVEARARLDEFARRYPDSARLDKLRRALPPPGDR